MDYAKKKPGGYKTLLAYKKSQCVFDITYYFVRRFMDRMHDRTVDQMQQAARSGKQNIVEGYSDAEVPRRWNISSLSLPRVVWKNLRRIISTISATTIWRFGV